MSITVKSLYKAYDEKKVLLNLNYQFPAKGVICLFGPSGCGKTTLLHTLAGLIRPDAGEITGLTAKKVSVVFQEDRLLPWNNAYENVALVKGEGDPFYWLAEFGLGEEAQSIPSTLSGGMQRRVALARALYYNGDVFFLDEPFKELDYMGKQGVMKKVREATKGKPVFMVTHDPQEAVFMSDYILRFRGIPLEVMEEIHITDEMRQDQEAVRYLRDKLERE